MPINFQRFSVGEIRDFLINEGYDEEDVRSKRKVELVDFIEEEALSAKLNMFYPDDEVSVIPEFNHSELDEEITSSNSVDNSILPNQPKKGSPEWNDFVISQFTPDEIVEIPQDKDKKIKGVKCDGLRRVAQLLFGEIVESYPVDQGINYPDYTINKAADQVKLKNPPFAWVKYIVAFQGKFGNIVRWGGLADVNANNTDPKFLAYAVATAETRAEARALRKALGIKILAAEEVSSIDTAATVESITNADWSEHEITDQQKTVINNMCRKMKISVYKLINCEFEDNNIKEGKVSYTGKNIRNASLDVLTNRGAKMIITILNEFQQNKRDRDDSILEN